MNTTGTNDDRHRVILQNLARRAMTDRGLLPDYSPAALVQLDGIRSPAASEDSAIIDVTALLWASIDNDDSRDLDQLTVAEALPGDAIKILVAVADVDGARQAGHRHRRTRPPQYDLGLYRGPDLSHAARKSCPPT